MIEHIPALNRHFSDHGWLQTYWLFSFGDYHDPENVHHGTLRVCNDDVVLPETGFGRHPHEEMEIVSIVLSGEMVHEDSMGNRQVIRAGDVQRMTAGTGLFHSEMNEGSEPVHFYQIWILPQTRGLTPSYDQKSYSDDFYHNRLALVAAPDAEGAVHLNSDGHIYRSRLDSGVEQVYQTDDERKVFVYIREGEVEVSGIPAGPGDQLRISEMNELRIQALTACEFILVDVPELN